MKNKILVVYHRVDLDGIGSAYLVYKHYRDIFTVEFLPYNYGEYKNLNINFQQYSKIFMVDILDKPFVDILLNQEHVIPLFIIDHHQHDLRYIDELKYNNNVTIIHNTHFAAIQIVSEHLFGFKPLFVELLGDYDRWNNEDKYYWNERVLPFQMYARTFIKSPTDKELDRMYYSDYYVEECIKKGKGILEYDKKLREDTIKEYMFEIEFEGYKVIACNTTLRGSQLFEPVWNENKYDLMIVFHYEPKLKKWTYHIYTTKTNEIDCSKIAKKYGGGGHKGAAGFQVDCNLF